LPIYFFVFVLILKKIFKDVANKLRVILKATVLLKIATTQPQATLKAMALSKTATTQLLVT
jgi:hypothetical protein